MYDVILSLFVRVQTETNAFLRREEGQGVTEYVLILAFVVLIIAAAVKGTDIDKTLTSKISEIKAGI